jgi:hypothetical protein
MQKVTLVINGDGKPYNYSLQIDNRNVSLSSVEVIYRADSTFGLLKMRNKDFYMCFKFNKVSNENNNKTIFYIGE